MINFVFEEYGGLNMSKICPNCKGENSDNAGFCQNCGNELKKPVNKPSRATVKAKPAGLGAWWRNLSTNGKSASVVSVCCIGLILIIAVSGFMSSENSNNFKTAAISSTTVDSAVSGQLTGDNVSSVVNGGNITITSSESDGSFLDEKSLVEVDTTNDVTKAMPILFANPNVTEVTLIRAIQVTNGYGQTSMEPGVTITMSRNTYNKINWSQWNSTPDLYYQSIYNDADSYSINPVIYDNLPSDVVLSQSSGN